MVVVRCGCGLSVLLWLALVLPQTVLAVGTPAGTVITNTATLSYGLAGVPQSDLVSSPVVVRVDEVIQPVLTWQDGVPVAVNSPGVNAALTFLLTNGGNGSEAFSLARVNGPAPIPAGNYTPLDGTAGAIFLESGAQPGFQASGPNADTRYVPGSNDPVLAADGSVTVYVVSDTPLVTANAQGQVRLDAAALTPGVAGAAPGAGFAGLGQGGSTAVAGLSRGQAQAIGSYIASGLGLILTKGVDAVLDPAGGNILMAGSIVTYRLQASLTGSGNALGLVITDPLPPEITYVPGSIAVNGVGKTDAADADNAQFITASKTLSVSLGDVAAPATVVITFRATIN